jgi:hypothetical protein
MGGLIFVLFDVGAMNIMTVMTALTGGATISWPFCRRVVSITGISILYGYNMGKSSPQQKKMKQAAEQIYPGSVPELGSR